MHRFTSHARLTPAALVVVAVAALFTVPACDSQTKVTDEDVPIIKEPQLLDMMGKKGVVLVDVRKPEQYAAGHIPGAVSIYLPKIIKNHPALGGARQIVVYASGYTDPLSLAASKRMVAMGYKNVVEFKGGIELWKDAGHKLVTSASDREVRPDSR